MWDRGLPGNRRGFDGMWYDVVKVAWQQWGRDYQNLGEFDQSM